MSDLWWELFERRVRREGECLLWTSPTAKNEGYPQLVVMGKYTRGHKLSWMIANGRTIPEGMSILHSCDTPKCVNPDHLRLGTAADNARDKMERGRHHQQRLTHCRNGHPYDDENTYVNPAHGRRACRTCHRMWAKTYYERKKAHSGAA